MADAAADTADLAHLPRVLAGVFVGALDDDGVRAFVDADELAWAFAHAFAAGDALVLVDLKGREVLDIFKQSAGTAAYYEGGLFLFKLLGNDLAAVFKVVGVDDPDVSNADGLGQRLEVYGNVGSPLRVFPVVGFC